MGSLTLRSMWDRISCSVIFTSLFKQTLIYRNWCHNPSNIPHRHSRSCVKVPNIRRRGFLAIAADSNSLSLLLKNVHNRELSSTHRGQRVWGRDVTKPLQQNCNFSHSLHYLLFSEHVLSRYYHFQISATSKGIFVILLWAISYCF